MKGPSPLLTATLLGCLLLGVFTVFDGTRHETQVLPARMEKARAKTQTPVVPGSVTKVIPAPVAVARNPWEGAAYVVRSRRAPAHEVLLDQPEVAQRGYHVLGAARVKLRLFDDVEVVLRDPQSKWDGEHTSIRYAVEGKDHAFALWSGSRQAATLMVTQQSHREYMMLFAEDGTVAVNEIDTNLLPTCGNHAATTSLEGFAESVLAGQGFAENALAGQEQFRPGKDQQALDHTHRAQRYTSSLLISYADDVITTFGTEAAFKSTINLAVLLSNTIMDSSRIHMSYRVAGYVRVGTTSQTDLMHEMGAARNSTTGVNYAAVTQARAEFQADQVVLIGGPKDSDWACLGKVDTKSGGLGVMFESLVFEGHR
jgi:hypothetical protein